METQPCQSLAIAVEVGRYTTLFRAYLLLGFILIISRDFVKFFTTSRILAPKFASELLAGAPPSRLVA